MNVNRIIMKWPNVIESLLILSLLSTSGIFFFWLRDEVPSGLIGTILLALVVVAGSCPFFTPIKRPVLIGSLVIYVCALFSLGVTVALVIKSGARTFPKPVLSVDAFFPTGRPSQSKLWFSQGSWWVWLPDGEGSSLWRRSNGEWSRESAMDGWLSRVPGRADVWAEDDLVMAVFAHEKGVTVAGLRYLANQNSYLPLVEPVHWNVPGKNAVESASIVRDSKGLWWIAYDDSDSIWIRRSNTRDGKRWSDPIKIGGPISKDDIAVLFPLQKAIGLVWSNQDKVNPANSRVEFRQHLDGARIDRWNPLEVVEQKFNTADDHLNAAVAPNGTVYLATKNEVDTPGKPQLVLRLRAADGTWSNRPYADRTVADMPTRPIVLLGGNPLSLFLVHNVFPQQPPGRHYVVFRQVDSLLCRLAGPDILLIPQRANLDIRDPSSTRDILPDEADWVILASDKKGNVYEGLLPKVAAKRTGQDIDIANPAEIDSQTCQ